MGILIATVILAITYMLVEDDISDSEVIARAKKLGMVEADSAIIRQQEATAESVQPENPAEDGVVQPPEGDQSPGSALQPPEGDSQETIIQTPSEQPSAEPVPEATPASQPQTDNGGTAEAISVTINSGQDGVTVCYMLQEKGIISDALDFSNYLSQKRMQTNIRPGTFELEKGMSYEELVKKIVW